MKTLTDLFQQFRCDKQTTHKYGPLYDLILRRYRDDPQFRFLEIGVSARGGVGMRSFESYFAGNTFGIDKRPRLGTFRKTHEICGDAYTSESVDRLIDECGAFDIIVDDGPHTLASHRFLFANYPPLVRPGGMIVCEDCTSHYAESELYEMVRKFGLYAIDLRLNPGTTRHDIVLAKNC